MDNPTLKSRATRLGISFVFNGKPAYMEAESDSTVLEMLGGHGHHGTREGCGEGDCGACTVAVGDLKNGELKYRAVTSCLMPAAQIHGKHLVTIEGIGNRASLHPVQQAIINSHGTQCGFCTPGFIMSLFVLFQNNSAPDDTEIKEFLTGNLCRCTGYDSIVHGARMALQNGAAGDLPETFRQAGTLISNILGKEPVPRIVRFSEESGREVSCHGNEGALFRPAYRIAMTMSDIFDHMEYAGENARILAGGSDLLVAIKKAGQQYTDLIDVTRVEELNRVEFHQDYTRIGAALSLSDLENDSQLMARVPALGQALGLMASPQVKALASLGGNLGNASPIADTVPPMWAMGSTIELASRRGVRSVPFDSFFLDYKKTVMQRDEMIQSMTVPVKSGNILVSFEKISKRRHLDIASANSCLVLEMESDGITVRDARYVVGGCGPNAIETVKAQALLRGRPLSAHLVLEAALMSSTEVEPMNDVRGSAAYRKSLTEGMMLKHFARLFPEIMQKLPAFSLEPEV
ncbi:MAG: hypothetical protein CVV64_05485 [Candidatus Wallbacteria bacterium HGW-Wallbacteria-1]|jgi:xanthine dehydrogenase small subunit|uniref:Xanthine dehydrogenase small subunit n=1 Tax=Candidatus Wallbacteria bacterium HGW-Wallbacteria-1 TaxID=2013854 RepID=A0A2N1PSH4_9BACT|nr:MAG: hypothetical protein CVV64_05485 [Candidatus Wallbacteria bacterium HGW-Wallbacteria-1]